MKKFLAVLAVASAVLFGQVATSEAHAVTANEPAFTFASEQISIHSCDKFNYVATTLKYVCDRCGKIITVSSDVNPNYPPDGLAYGCPGTGGKNYKGSFTKGDRHFWRWVTD